MAARRRATSHKGIGYRPDKANSAHYDGRCWYKVAKNEVHNAVFSNLAKLDGIQQLHHDRMLTFMRIYTNRPIDSLSGGSYTNARADSMRLVTNIAKGLVDAAMAKISTKRVKVMFLTHGGDPKQKRRAENLSKFVAGQMHHTHFFRKARIAFRDAAIFGKGFLKIYDDGEDIKVERVLPTEIMVDDEDARYGCPRQLFQYKEVARDRLKAMWPKHKHAIDEASQVRRGDDVDVSESLGDAVSVIEAWYLPSAPDAKDGRHTICCDSVTLVDEPWESERFPFVTLQWSEPVIGYWGHGIIEEIKEKQLELNHLEQKIQEEMDLGGVKIFVQKGSKIAKTKISNARGAIYEVTNPQDITVHNASMVAQETWMAADRHESKMYDITGISRLAAQSKKPDGLDSGKALREYKDSETERFQHVVQMYEESCLDAAQLMIDLAKRISERPDSKQYSIMAEDKDHLIELKWSDVNMDRDKYIMKMYPTNFLPSTPPGQWQQVQEMLQAGFLSREEGMELLQYPDLDRVSSRSNAPYRIIELDIEAMLVDGEPMAPEPYYNLQLAGQMCQFAYLKARSEDYDDTRLELLRRYIDQVKTLMQPPAPPAPPPGAGPAATPPQAGPPAPGPQIPMGDAPPMPPQPMMG